MNSIKKTEVDLEKITQEPLILPFRYSGQDYKEEPTRYSTDSEEFAMKRHQEEFVSMMADQAALKETMAQEIQQLVAKRVQLTENLESATVKLQQLIHNK